MTNRILFFIFFISLLFGCAGHSTFALKQLTNSEHIQINKNGVSIFVRPFIKTDELQNYFAEDLVQKGILPIQLHILNESESDIGITTDSFLLLPPDGNVINTATSDDAYRNAKSGYGATPIFTIAFLTVGFLGSIGNVTDANIKLSSDLQSKLLKSGIVQKHRFSDGVVFFPIKKNIQTLDGWHLSIPVYCRNISETFNIKIQL